ncbi:MAG TPA: IPExxxVDY family protein [Cytophagaceae bacterium]|jgi:hypothetical protein|nr:IPExxxVDY family protein [Cytophagaceae bacterium]
MSGSKTIKLVVEYDYDFGLIGLISPLKGHKLAWCINNELRIDLRKEDDLYIDFLHEGQLVIIHYIYETEYSNFRLIKNKSCEFANIASPYLIPELKEYDYFIQIKDEGDAYNIPQTIDKLKGINGIEYIKEIETENLKSKDNLIF